MGCERLTRGMKLVNRLRRLWSAECSAATDDATEPG